MLAGAAPCMKPNAKLENFVPRLVDSVIGDKKYLFRPICGRLIICLKNPAWKTFESSYDLFRHEIMHALVGTPFHVFIHAVTLIYFRVLVQLSQINTIMLRNH